MISIRFLTSTWLALVLVNPATARGDDPALQEIFLAQAEIHSLQGDFTQTKVLTLFDETLISSGTIVIEKPDFYCWIYQDPEYSVFYVNGSRTGSYEPGTGVREDVDLENSKGLAAIIRAVTPIVSGNLDESSQEEFRISKAPSDDEMLSYTLHPRPPELQSLFERVTIRFDRHSHLARELKIEEKNGDSTRIEFAGWQVNVPVDRSLLLD